MLSTSEAENLLTYEANLLDNRQFDEWLSLFTKEGVYWIPIQEDKQAEEAASLIYDNTLRRQERVFRLTQTLAPAQDPPSRTMHFITGVQIEEKSEEELIIHSNQLIYEMRQGNYHQAGIGEQRSFAGRCSHYLQKEYGEWKIALKKVILLNRDIPISNFSFII